jgi:N4-(beta-N-acetylglucosaminyl)-L-asparaginase
MTISRRRFLGQSAAAGLLGAVPLSHSLGAPWVRRSAVEPVVIASMNGNWYRNGGKETCVELAWRLMTQGSDVLDALIAGVNILELDPAEDSVGYGGLPNADGVVQLDSCCMHGPRRRAGGVAGLEGVRTPSKVAKLVMDHTDHHLLVGAGAQHFARMLGFEILPDLNTPNSRAKYLEWKQRIDPLHYIKDPEARAAAERQVLRGMIAEGLVSEDHLYGTINCDGINARGDVAGVTTTSGLSWKIPGRLGDSPILGAGLYVDNDVGAAGSTGRGEANLYGLCSFLIVEEMRRGAHPKDAGLTALRRVQANTGDRRLLNSRGLPNFGLSFYILDKRGDYAGVALYGGRQFAVCDERGPRLEPLEPLLAGQAEDE